MVSTSRAVSPARAAMMTKVEPSHRLAGIHPAAPTTHIVRRYGGATCGRPQALAPDAPLDMIHKPAADMSPETVTPARYRLASSVANSTKVRTPKPVAPFSPSA